MFSTLDQQFNFTLAYNYNDEQVQGIIAQIDQAISLLPPGVATLTAAQYLSLFNSALNFNQDLSSAEQVVLDVIAAAQAAVLNASVDAGALIQKFQADLQEGKRVLLMAHGQGNLFANLATLTLMDSFGASIGQIGLSNPSLATIGNAVYYTGEDDAVINALRLLQDVLPANVDNNNAAANAGRDTARYQFERSYFAAGLASRQLIDADFDRLIQSLQFPNTDLGSGAITVTLTWGAQPDVDLHVYEPSGDHVYYRQTRGTSGFLDRDDTDGFGPEHYFADCENLLQGNYRVAVNYYDGDGPAMVQVQISTADGNTRTFVGQIDTDVGPAGDDSPLDVATITVLLGDSNRYTYEVN